MSRRRVVGRAPPPIASMCSSPQQKKQKRAKDDKEVIGQAALRVMENPAFVTYYQAQLGLAQGEWMTFETCLRSPLPVTWRFSGHDDAAVALRMSMERILLPSLSEKPHPLPWYPLQLGWHFDVSRAQLRGKDWDGADAPEGGGRSDAVKALHTWLLRETDLGRVHRQEAVSMVPPLLLDVRAGHSVVDLCASPGSKTQQILELLAVDAGASRSDNVKGGGVGATAGLVIANDADIKRCHLLASRAAKLNSPGLIVANHDARLFPEALGVEGTAVPLRFDRVLADVPCTGDGTLRKNPLIWKRWVASNGNMLHSLQLQIACKGVRLTKVGGRLVYSTCSLNPIENEAVVARVLDTFGPECVRLVNVSHELPALRRRPGLKSWRVWHRGQWHETWQSVVDRFPQKCPRLQTLFPPTDGADDPKAATAAFEAMHLERCVRLLPHDQDCSGFFIAVFEKIGEHSAEAGALPEDEPEVCVVEGGAVLPDALSTNHKDTPANGGSASAGRASKKSQQKATAEAQKAAETIMANTQACAEHEAVLHAVGGATIEAAAAASYGNSYSPMFVPRPSLVDGVVRFFGLEASFPRSRLIARSPAGRSLLLLSEQVLSLLRADSTGALKIVHTGVRLFEREEAKGCAVDCGYRVCQDGLPHVLSAQRAQRAPCKREAAIALLQSKERVPQEEVMKVDANLEVTLREHCQPGSVVLTVADVEDGLPLNFTVMYAPSGSVGPMVKGGERDSLLFRLGVERQTGAGGGSGMEDSKATVLATDMPVTD